MSLNDILQQLNAAFPDTDQKMPILFVGHGSPMNAIENNEFSRAWNSIGRELPKPRAILCVSAHWYTRGTLVTGMDKPKTIHDFGGFPRELYEQEYPAPGSPALARLTQAAIKRTDVIFDEEWWGLDHGTWSVLARMFPQADVPVVQLSLDGTQPGEYHYALGQELSALRNKGVLIVGSGNIVHNLQLASFQEDGQDQAYDWAIEFDQTIKDLIERGDHASIVNYQKLGLAARLSIPTNDHYLPLLYILAQQAKQETVRFFAAKVLAGSLSMRSVLIQ